MGGAGGVGNETEIAFGVTDDSGADVFFMDGAQLIRQPNSVTPMWVQTTPLTLVRTALLPNGDQVPGGAALDWTQLATDDTGRVNLRLTAPSTPTSFLLRAWATERAATQLEVRIAELGSTSLTVVPAYVGKRPIEAWTASATVDQTCAGLSGSPPPDGPYTNQMLEPPALDAVTVDNVPSGRALAVTIRAAGYAWGCTSLPSAAEGQRNSVQVTVTNVPLHLDSKPISLVLALTSRSDWADALEAPLLGALEALLDGQRDDVEALLDAMQASLGASARDEFSTTRDTERWDLRVRTALGAATAPTGLRAPLERWMRAGLEAAKLERAFETELRADADGNPELTLEKSFGFEPDTAGVRATGSTLFHVDPGDSVLISPDFEIASARLLLAYARGEARAEVDGAGNVAEALAEILSCDIVADTLVAYGLGQGDENNECDADCAAELCNEAVEELVARAAAASDDDKATLSIAVTGPGQVGAQAQLKALDGGWLGKFSLGDATSDLAGDASASSD